MAAEAGASACAKYVPNPANQGGGYHEVRLRVSADHMAAAADALKAMPGVIAANVKTIPLASSSAAPTAEGGVDGPLAC